MFITYHKKLTKNQRVVGLNLELPDGELVRRKFKEEGVRLRKISSVVKMYGLTLLIAVTVAALYLAIKYSAEIMFDKTQHRGDEHKEPVSIVADLFIKTAFSVLFALTGGLICMYQPSAVGPGVPEIIGYLNGAKFSKYITVTTLLCKSLALLLIVASGLKSGYDGPMAHIGLIVAIVFLRFSKSADIRAMSKYDHKEALSNKGTPESKREFLVYGATGAATGIAAAFKSPIGAVVFALEEAVTHFTPKFLLCAFFGTILSFFLAGLPYSIEGGGYVTLEKLSIFVRNVSCKYTIDPITMLFFVAFGILMGVLGQLFNMLVIAILKLKRRYLLNRPLFRLLEIVLICFLTRLFDTVVPHYLDECVPYDNMFNHMRKYANSCGLTCADMASAKSMFKSKPSCRDSMCLPDEMNQVFKMRLNEAASQARSMCQANPQFEQKVDVSNITDVMEIEKGIIHDKVKKCYYPLHTLFSASPDDIIKILHNRGTYSMFNFKQLSIFGSLYLVLAVLTYGIMMPTDLVLPTLTIGSFLGRLLGLLFNFSKTSIPGSVPIDPGVTALIGSMAFWGSSSQMIIAVALISIESTMNLEILPALSVALLLAVIFSKVIGESLYHSEIQLYNIPYLPHDGGNKMQHITAQDLMTNEYYLFSLKTSRGKIMEALEKTRCSGFPVVKNVSEGETMGKPIGIILRSQLKYLMENQKTDVENLDGNDFYIGDIMTSPPITVGANMIGSKVYDLFRRLGLRHLMVVDDDVNLVGIITRETLLNKLHH